MAEVDCRHFNGYKPCGLNEDCSHSCPSRDVALNRILIVHLEALGAVLRATCLLPLIRKKYPKSHITWVTKAPANHVLDNNPFIDQVLTISNEDLLRLSCLKFDVAFCIDKSLLANGVLNKTQYDYLYGFFSDDRSGAILPANASAKELWQIGLSNQKKFYENKKTENQLMVEALDLGEYKKNEYQLFLTAEERASSRRRRSSWAQPEEVIVGINTGCAPTISYKKLSIDGHRELIKQLKKVPGVKVVLLGGKQDTTANKQIAQGLDVELTPTDQGIRDGLVSMNACDIVISGDSFGMHMAIGLKKWVVAWFGPTCSHEIDLYGRGCKILSKAECGPCWKRSCQKQLMCYDQVSYAEIILAVEKGKQWAQTSSLSKPHLLVTPS